MAKKKEPKLFHEQLHSTAQPDTFHTDVSNLPDEIYEQLRDAEIEIFDELGGGGAKLTLTDAKIDGWIYDVRYTVEYFQDYENAFPDSDLDEIHEELLARAEEFIGDGLHGSVYVDVIDNDIKLALKVRNMHNASTDLYWFESDEAHLLQGLHRKLDYLDKEDFENGEDYQMEREMIFDRFQPRVLENINWRKIKHRKGDPDFYYHEDDVFLIFNEKSFDLY